VLAGWAAAALLAAGPAPAPARCLNRIPVRVRRSAAGRAGQRSGRRPASAVSAGPSGASRVSVASASPLVGPWLMIATGPSPVARRTNLWVPKTYATWRYS